VAGGGGGLGVCVLLGERGRDEGEVARFMSAWGEGGKGNVRAFGAGMGMVMGRGGVWWARGKGHLVILQR
jgi:hypothetical protein